MLEDKLLLWRCKLGSKDALRIIYQKYKDDLLTLARGLLNDASAAEDVVHDVFVAFAEAIDNFHLTGSLKGYLAACVGNLARDRIRAAKRRPAKLDEQSLTGSDAKNPVQQLIRTEEITGVRQAMARLPYEQREVILLHLQGRLTFKKIAAAQKVSINTVQGRYRYGLDKLRSLLNSEIEK